MSSQTPDEATAYGLAATASDALNKQNLNDPRPTTAGVYRPELDILRFVAFSMVFFYHVAPGSSGVGSIWHRLALPLRDCGAFGVPVFFMLSAFLITDLLIREKGLTGKIRIPAFYIRRSLRIWPLYFFIIALTARRLFVAPIYGLTAAKVIAFSFFVGNFYVGAYGFGHDPLVPLWSISIEEQYYLLWPGLIALTSIRGLTRMSVAIIALSYVSLIYFAVRHVDLSVVWPNSLVQMQYLAAGSILAVLNHGRIASHRRSTRIALISLAFLLFFLADACFKIKTTGLYTDVATPFGYLTVLCASVVLLKGFLGASIPSWLRPMMYLGKISYGMYMFHFIVIDFVTSEVFTSKSTAVAIALRALISLALTIVIAALSYRFFEKPFLRMKERFTYVRSREA